MKVVQLRHALAIAGVLVYFSFPVKADPLPRDGAHDFDFARGVWHTHATQVLDELQCLVPAHAAGQLAL